MPYRIAQFGEMYDWGVWLAPYTGMKGEFILVAVDSKRRRVAEAIVPLGADHVAVAERLYDQLDAVDPEARRHLRAI